MIIGATNSDSDDLSRFEEEYDITITGNVKINMEEPKLLSLYSDDNNITQLNDPLNDNVYKKLGYINEGLVINPNIYAILSKHLPDRFSKIIYDWSTTEFILNNNQIFDEL